LWPGRLYGAAFLGALLHFTSPAPCSSQETLGTDETGYGFIRVIEGSVSLVEFDTGERTPAEVNDALLVGDRMVLSGGARAELVLSDRSVARLGDRAEVSFVAMARSPDRSDRATVLDLGRGTAHLVVPDDFLGDVAPAVETGNAYVELRGPGSYVVSVTADDRTTVIVREGAAAVRTGSGTYRLGRGEEATAFGYDGSQVTTSAARTLLALEEWGRSLVAGLGPEDIEYVDASLHYAAAPLSSHGSWVYVRGHHAWRPHVKHGWRPYWHGRWRYTPTGYLWVSYEPWGWVPYHYGYWDHVPGYGWVWFPGRRFATAHVFWYWGPRYVGWVPSGYYRHHYGPGLQIRFGIYGWAGGLFVGFRDWCFLPVDRFRHRRPHHYLKTGRALGTRHARLERGIITTDTRAIKRGHWKQPKEIVRVLDEEGRRKGRRGELPDVNPFVRRMTELPPVITETLAMNETGRNRGADFGPPSIDPVVPNTYRSGAEAGGSRRAFEREVAKRPRIGTPQHRDLLGDAERPLRGTSRSRPSAERPKVEPRTIPVRVTPRTERPKVEPRTIPIRVTPRTDRPKVEPREQPRRVKPVVGRKGAERPKVEPRKVEASPRPRRSEPRSAKPSVEPRRTKPSVRQPQRTRVKSSAEPRRTKLSSDKAKPTRSSNKRTKSRRD
jgi:hypothetical protein